MEHQAGPEGVAAILRLAGHPRDWLTVKDNWLPFPLADAPSSEALRCLRIDPFPGNVRDLENEIERAVALTDDG